MYETRDLAGRSGRGLGGGLGVGALQDPLGSGLFSETESSFGNFDLRFFRHGGGFAGVLPIARRWTRCAAAYGKERPADAA
jgi:hypothetical protein